MSIGLIITISTQKALKTYKNRVQNSTFWALIKALIATLEIGISLFTDLTKGLSIQFSGDPYPRSWIPSRIMLMLARHYHVFK